RLPDPSVSRIHCAVVATPRGVWLVDLLSREGTRVRGEPVQFTRLEEGDRFEVGIYRLRIRYHQHGAAAPAASTAPPTLPVGQGPGAVVAPPVMVVNDGPSALVPLAAGPGGLVAESPLLGALVQQFSAMQQ